MAFVYSSANGQIADKLYPLFGAGYNDTAVRYGISKAPFRQENQPLPLASILCFRFTDQREIIFKVIIYQPESFAGRLNNIDDFLRLVREIF